MIGDGRQPVFVFLHELYFMLKSQKKQINKKPGA